MGGPPVALFHTVFGEFSRDMNDANLPLTDEIIRITEDFLWESADIYKNEETRLTKIKATLGKVFGDIVDAICGNEARSDGVLLTSIGGERAYRMILEEKNEIGIGGCDPTIQFAQYYRTYWSQNNVCKQQSLKLLAIIRLLILCRLKF
jgi:hypothetical protein